MASQLPNELKDYLISIEASLFRFEKDCIQNGKPFTMKAIKLFIKSGYSTQGLTFEALVEEFFRSLRLKCKAGGLFQVNGYKHKGKGQVKYDEGSDLFSVILLDRTGKETRKEEGIYLDCLMNVIDGLVEKTDDYSSRVRSQYGL